MKGVDVDRTTLPQVTAAISQGTCGVVVVELAEVTQQETESHTTTRYTLSYRPTHTQLLPYHHIQVSHPLQSCSLTGQCLPSGK